MISKYRNHIEGFFLSISEIFFVRQWKSGLALWLVMMVLYPLHAGIGSLALLISIILHPLFRTTLTPQIRQWLGLNALLVGFGYVHFFGFQLEASYFGLLVAILFIHQILYQLLLATVDKQLQLPVLTLSFIIIVKMMASGAPSAPDTIDLAGWAHFGERLNETLGQVLPEGITWFFRSLGTLLFVRDILVGIAIAVIIVQYSRILFSLAVVSFVPLLVVRNLLPQGVDVEILAFNVMITVMMIGAVLEIPSRWSYRYAALFGVLAFLLGLLILDRFPPSLNLPFLLSVYAYLFIRQYVNTTGALPFDFSAGSPEQNLYYAQNRRDRYVAVTLPSYALPFFGEWKVTQAHEGEYTHKNDWQHAWDFEQVDEAGKFSRNGSLNLHDFYAYRKPVCASLEGEVVNVQAFVPDNEAGNFNFGQNWGNTVVLRHPNGQCSAYSHLSYLAETMFIGRWVNKGEVVGYCGNSGRSERPHLHFQFQPAGKIGEKTIRLPFKKYVVRSNGEMKMKVCDVPLNGELVSNHIFSPRIAGAFTFPYGKTLFAGGTIGSTACKEAWISTVDFYNHTFLWSEEKKAAAYFFSEDGIFYFADYFGPEDSLLYYFSLAASRVVFSEQNTLTYKDQLPLNRVHPAFSNFLVDMITPVQPIKEVQCSFRVCEESDRTITIRNTIATVNRFMPSRSHTVAESEMVMPYGTQSVRVSMNMKRTKVSMTVMY